MKREGETFMEQQRPGRSGRERVGMSIEVNHLNTLVDVIIEAEQAGVEQIWYMTRIAS